MTTPPEPQPGDTLETRVGKLETGQESMSDRLDKILGLLDHGQEGGSASTTTADPPPAAADMAEQMRQAVRDVHAEREAANAKADPPKPEVPPREAGQPLKQRLQRALYGKEPKRS